MPKLRPRVCQKIAILGPARFQDAIWKCFKCQEKRDTPLFCFHFLFSSPSFPLVSFIVSLFRPCGSLSSTWTNLFPRKGSGVCRAAAFAAHLFLLPPLTARTFFPLCLCGPHPAILLPSCLVMRLGTPCLRFYLSVVIFRSSIHEATGVQQMCSCDGCRLSRGPSGALSLNVFGRG